MVLLKALGLVAVLLLVWSIGIVILKWFTSRLQWNAAPLTRAERSLGRKNIRFTPAYLYRNWRNPLRNLRRFLGWPSGRQWRITRKKYSRVITGLKEATP